MGGRVDRRVAPVVGNLGALVTGSSMAVFSGLPLAARVPLSVVAGAVGYLLGGWLAGVGLRALRRARLAAPGAPVYELRRLPPSEPGAGGKARNLARLAQAGFRVPAGVVVLPRGFDGDTLTAEAGDRLRNALARIGGERFAVRSSASAEDSAHASFAGGFETVLDVAPADVPEAVGRVRRSGSSERVAAYAAARGVEDSGQVAVIVQRMVSPELAGVLFTVDPLSGDLSTMYGNVAAGLGEQVVSGEADAADFRLSRPEGRYSGPPALAAAASELHDCACDAESVFDGAPQDLEWALADGRVWLLQARPVTTLTGWDPVTAERNDSLTGTCLWSATNLTEANPEPQTPLTISVLRYQQEHGGPSMKLRGREMAGSIGGRPYVNLSVQVSARGRRAAADPRRVYTELAGLWGELPEEVPLPLVPLRRADWQEEGLRLLGTLGRLYRARADVPAFLETSLERCQSLTGKVAAASSPARLLDLWTREVLPASLRSFWAVIAVTGDRIDPVDAELRELVGPEDAAVLLANVSGLAGGLESLGPVAGLHEVLAGRLSREEYVARFGHRGHNEVELAWPRPAEDPGWLDTALLSAAAGADVSALRTAQQAAFAAALGRLRAAHPRTARRIEGRLLRRARLAARREAVRSEAVRWTGLGRRFALRAGELLGIGDGVFLLTIEELLAALGGDTAAFATLDLRRDVLARYRALPALPAFIVGRFDPFAWAADPERRTDYVVAGRAAGPDLAPVAGLVTGSPGSLGVAQGRVRRLERIEDADLLQPGEVLVTHLTNIGWTPLFPRAAAIVTDLGAPLSHAAIVARELGLPAVVGCGDATARLRDGDLVEVDGARGTVQLLDAATESRDTLEHVFDSPSRRG